MTKLCSSCNLEKEIACFSINKTSKDGYHSKCKSCKNAVANAYYYNNKQLVLNRVKQYREANVDKIKITQRIAHLKHKYDLSIDQYEQLLKDQNYSCAICDIKFENRPDVDHDHKTGKVRGLLCRRCNLVVGIFEKYGFIEDLYTYLVGV